VEVTKRLWHRLAATLVQAWVTFARVVGAFLDECAFRVVLAFRVLFGLVPLEVERRPWDRAIETPALLDVFDWTDGRLIFSVLIWPPLEASASSGAADDAFYERISDVKQVIYAGAQDRALSTFVETTYGLRWDPGRVCWVDRDRHGYDGNREIVRARLEGRGGLKT
jgi:hypothetical protein